MKNKRNLSISIHSPSQETYASTNGQKSARNALKLDLKSQNKFDKKLIQHLASKDLINPENVRSALADQRKAHKPFINVGHDQVGSVTFLPSPEGKSLKHLQKSRLAPNLSKKVLDLVLAEAQGFADDIDLTKT